MNKTIVEYIYQSCDEEKTDSVPVSSLITFIKPYMLNNPNELVVLQTELDPNNTNPNVSSSFFQRIMNDWIVKIQSDDVNNSFLEFSLSTNQPLSQNASLRSTNNSNNNIIDVNSEEELNSLRLQLNKVTAEWELLKRQLVVCEDQNESLLADLNACRKLNNKELSVDDQLNKTTQANEDFQEQINLLNRKCEQLERALEKSNKKEGKLLDQIYQLESENTELKIKLQASEKNNKENVRCLSEMTDRLEDKELENGTLVDIIASLKSEIEEKNDRLNFYTNEHKLLKRKTRDLEILLGNNTRRNSASVAQELANNFKDNFNTPKLLNQLANPVSPTFHTPLLVKGYHTSSPLKNTSASSNGLDLFSAFGAVTTVLRSPHKTLQEELAEMNDNIEELGALNKIIKDQEDIKNDLWLNMKRLSVDNENLNEYKEKYFELVDKLQQKERSLQILKEKSESERETTLKGFEIDLANLESNLLKQRLLNMCIEKKLTCLNVSLNKKLKPMKNKSSQVDVESCKSAAILIKSTESQTETEQCKSTVQIESKESQTDAEECKSAETKESQTNVEHKSIVHLESRESQTEVETAKSTVQTELRSFARQQMKIDRLLEKQQIIEKYLASERNINVKLTLNYEEKVKENEKLNQDLGTYRAHFAAQISCLEELVSEKNKLIETISVLEGNNNSLVSKIASLGKEILNLETVKQELRKNLQQLLEEQTEIRTLKKQMEDEVSNFMASCNDQLSSAIREVFCCLKFDEGFVNLPIMDQQFQNNDFVVHPENLKIILSNNIALVITLLQNVCDKYVNSQLKTKSESSVSCEDNKEISVDNEDYCSCCSKICLEDEDSFVTCSDDISSFGQEVLEIPPFDLDSFLDSVYLDNIDLRDLSRKEMEERFTTFALLLTIDAATSNKRNLNERTKFNLLMSNFFSYLNDSIHLLSTVNNCFEAMKLCRLLKMRLQMLKDLSEDMLQAAAKFGILHYEKRTMNLWKLVTNYVAILSQENKQLKKKSSKKKLEVMTIPGYFVGTKNSEVQKSLPPECVTRDKGNNSRYKPWLFISFLLFAVSFVGFLIYIDYHCQRTGVWICPFEWFKNLFVEKTI